MKKLLTICAVATLVMALSATSHAALTLSFDPNVLVSYSTTPYGASSVDPVVDERWTFGNVQTQTNPRKVYEGEFGTSTAYRSWVGSGAGSQSDTVATFFSSLDSAGEGIRGFNLWFADDLNARRWGEFLSGDTIAATAASGWTAELVANPWHAGWNIAKFYTTDDTKYIRPGGPDIGIFTVTVDGMLWSGSIGNPPVYSLANSEDWSDIPGYDSAVYGITPDTTLDSQYKVWFGIEDPDATSAYGVVSDWYSDGVGALEGSFMATIPEPATTLVWSLLSLVGLVAAGYGEWRRKQAA